MKTVAPIRLLSESNLRMMLADFSSRRWQKTEPDKAFSAKAAEGIRAELARREQRA